MLSTISGHVATRITPSEEIVMSTVHVGGGSSHRPPTHAMCTPHACHMRAMCMPFACHTHAICVPCACHMRATRMPYACHVHAMCTPHACHMRAMCMPYACHVHIGGRGDHAHHALWVLWRVSPLRPPPASDPPGEHVERDAHPPQVRSRQSL